MPSCKNNCCKYEIKKYERCIFTPRNKQKAGVFIYDPHAKKLLLVQSRGNLWGPPKGSVEENESVINCALREVLEETGISLNTDDIGNNNKFIFNDSHYFYYTMDEIPVTLETPMISSGTNDASGIGWFQIECLKELISSKTISINFHCKLLIEYFLKINT